jgi:hypothetical protein
MAPAWASEPKTIDQLASSQSVCLQPDAWPVWLKPDWVSKENPTAENNSLVSWCNDIEKQLNQMIQNKEGWNSKVNQISCTFLVTSDGELQDPYIWSSADVSIEPFVNSVFSQPLRFAKPPAVLKNRRLNLELNYPKIKLFLDFNETGTLDEREKYFNYVRSKHL